MTGEVHIDDIVTKSGFPGIEVSNGNPQKPIVYFAFLQYTGLDKCWMMSHVGSNCPPYDGRIVDAKEAPDILRESARELAADYAHKNGSTIVDHTN